MLNILSGFYPENVEVRSDESATQSNVFCCLELVTCEHPNFYTSLLQVLDCFGYLVLKLIFDSSSTKYKQSSLELVIHSV